MNRGKCLGSNVGLVALHFDDRESGGRRRLFLLAVIIGKGNLGVIAFHIRYLDHYLMIVLVDDISLVRRCHTHGGKQHLGDDIHALTADEQLIAHLHLSGDAFGRNFRS